MINPFSSKQMERLEANSGLRTGLTEKEREISANAIQRHVETEERASRLRAQHSTLDEEDEDDEIGGESLSSEGSFKIDAADEHVATHDLGADSTSSSSDDPDQELSPGPEIFPDQNYVRMEEEEETEVSRQSFTTVRKFWEGKRGGEPHSSDA